MVRRLEYGKVLPFNSSNNSSFSFTQSTYSMEMFYPALHRAPEEKKKFVLHEATCVWRGACSRGRATGTSKPRRGQRRRTIRLAVRQAHIVDELLICRHTRRYRMSTRHYTQIASSTTRCICHCCNPSSWGIPLWEIVLGHIAGYATHRTRDNSDLYVTYRRVPWPCMSRPDSGSSRVHLRSRTLA